MNKLSVTANDERLKKEGRKEEEEIKEHEWNIKWKEQDEIARTKNIETREETKT